MFYYKIMAALFLGTGVGLAVWKWFSKQHVQTSQYQQILLFLTRLRCELARRQTLPAAILEASRDLEIEKDAESMWNAVRHHPTVDLHMLWEPMWERYALPQEERQNLIHLLSLLEMKERQEQQILLERWIHHFEKRTDDEEEIWRKQKSVYVKLSTMIGLLVVIVLL